MNPFMHKPAFLVVVPFILFSAIECQSQVVVNGKNLNKEKDLEYIQVMFYVDKSTFKPVFHVDFGFIEPEYDDINYPERDHRQTIMINGEEINDRVTIVWVLNKMHKAGWEYLGDEVFVRRGAMGNWQVFTMQRRKVGNAG